MLSPKAVLHGVVDPTFASRTASESVAPSAQSWTAEQHEAIVALRDDIRVKIAREVNRIEGQLSLMVSHLEGEYQSKIALLKGRKTYLPLIVGFATGAIVVLVVSWMGRS